VEAAKVQFLQHAKEDQQLPEAQFPGIISEASEVLPS
jgi:hypothetical protein